MKETISKVKRQPSEWEKIIANEETDKELMSKIRYPYVHGFISGPSILFHCSIFLFLCQYHTVLMTVAL